MHTLSISDLKDFLRFVSIGQREPTFIWGEPGVGKSEAVAQLAKELGALLIDIRLSQYDSVDLRGIPDAVSYKTIDMEADLNDPNAFRMTKWCQPSTMPFKGNPLFAGHELIILFLDEMNSASPATMAVGYQLVNDRRVGEHELMDNVIVIAAGNREGDRGVTNKMPLPLANRFTHVEAGADADGWCFWMQDAGYDPIGAAFIQFRKPLLSTFKEMKTTGDKAIATPRTWIKALKYWGDTTMPGNIKQAAISGAIGAGPAAEFWGFTAIWQQVGGAMKEIKKNPATAPIPDEASMLYAIAVSISGSMDVKTVPIYHTYLMRMAPEFAILAWQLATRRDSSVLSTKEFIVVAKTFKEVFSG